MLLTAAVAIVACDSGDDPGPAGDDDGGVGGGGRDGGYPGSGDTLDTAAGCAGVYNPDQILDYHFAIDSGDLSKILGDLTYSIVVPAEMSCGDGPQITVGIRRKRSGGQRKVGFKVDINELVPGQTFFDLRKLSLENGVSSGDNTDGADVREYVGEYLAWRAMVLSGALAGRAAFANVFINGERFGVYVNVEHPDKRFLDTFLSDDSGWLYKKSGGIDDGLKTHETDGADDPYDDYFCFWESGNGCTAPSATELAAELPGHLDIPQMLRVGAVNAVIANPDAIIFKDNNYYWYDWQGGRIYLPWDLDTAWRGTFDPLTGGGGGGGSDMYTAVLFSNWSGQYEDILRDLLDNRLTVEVILAELDRADDVASDSFAADPYVSGGASAAVDGLRDYWTSRHAAIRAQLGQ